MCPSHDVAQLAQSALVGLSSAMNKTSAVDSRSTTERDIFSQESCRLLQPYPIEIEDSTSIGTGYGCAAGLNSFGADGAYMRHSGKIRCGNRVSKNTLALHPIRASWYRQLDSRAIFYEVELWSIFSVS